MIGLFDMCMFMYVWVRVSTHVSSSCGGRRSLLNVIPEELFGFVLRQSLLLAWYSLGWLAIEPSGFTCLCFPNIMTTSMCHYAWFFFFLEG